MFQSVWLRRIHRFLAVWVSVAFVLVIVTGTILAWYATGCNIGAQGNASLMNSTSISDLMISFQDQFDFIDAIEFDECGHVFVRGEHVDYAYGTWEWDILVRNVINERVRTANFVQWAAVLHRSFFLGTIGRVWAAITTLLFLILTITGLLLWLKTHGFKLKPSNILHVDLGLVLFIPLCILSLTGLSMSAAHFGLWKFSNTESKAQVQDGLAMKDFIEFEIFQAHTLSEIQSIDFPFAFDEEEWFYVRFRNGVEVSVDALRGIEMGQIRPSAESSLLQWMADVHTGDKSLGWSLLWLFSGLASCLAIWTGLQIWYRKRSQIRVARIEDISSFDISLVVASQGGTTWKFADEFQKGLGRNGLKAQVFEFENFSPDAFQGDVVFMVATYGKGTAPEHLWNWRNQIEGWTNFSADSKVSVIGFGDRKYEQFAQFGTDLAEALVTKTNGGNFIQSQSVNSQNWHEFQVCVDHVCEHFSMPKCPVKPQSAAYEKNSPLTLQVHHVSGTDSLFWIEFLQKGKTTNEIKSGDLIAFVPPEGGTERYYSLSVQPDGIYGICVRLVEGGKCSTWLSKLQIGSTVYGRVQFNTHFHLKNTDENLIFVANGSGIGPLFGMIASLPDNQNATILWGVREKNEAVFAQDMLNNARMRGALKSVYLTFSSEPENGVKYVQDFFTVEDKHLQQWTNPKTRFIICGSDEMLKGLESTLKLGDAKAFEVMRKQKRWQSDCY